MRIQQFLEHHGIRSNPFAEEDAQTDPVFKDHCIHSTYHPAWDKVYGEPVEPATAIVFGEKGAGKTALRLQVVRHLEEHNRAHPDRRVFVIEYDDFNPFLDRFREKLPLRRRQPGQMLSEWKLWDHMDAILSLGVTKLVDRILANGAAGGVSGDSADRLSIERLDRNQKRDVLLLAACYDQSLAEPLRMRWRRLKRRLRFHAWKSLWPLVVGIVVTLAVAGVIGGMQKWAWLTTPWPYLVAAAGWIPFAWRSAACWLRAWGIARQLRVLNHDSSSLARVLARFTREDLVSQPLPNRERTDDRFELLGKLQGVLKSLGYGGIVVLVDRIDEPNLVNGSPEQMRALLWPMLDNKLLKHPGVGFKLLLPIELSYFIEREGRDFYQRARLDKQNLIPSLNWTGEALYDVANSRLNACAVDGQAPTLRELFEPAVTSQRLIDALRSLRVPRHMFKFLYRLLVTHANAHTDEQPTWQISGQTFESVLALYQRDQDAFDRGMGAG